jgi:hypothetical protein
MVIFQPAYSANASHDSLKFNHWVITYRKELLVFSFFNDTRCLDFCGAKGKYLLFLLKFVQISVYSWLTFFVFISSGKAGYVQTKVCLFNNDFTNIFFASFKDGKPVFEISSCDICLEVSYALIIDVGTTALNQASGIAV